VHHPAVYETVHHPAVYETVVVTDVEAWDEQVLVTPEIPAYDETVQVEADHNGYTLNAAAQLQQKKHYPSLNAQFFNIGTIKNGFKVIDDVGCGVNKIWVPVFENKIVHHPAVPAVYETVHHEAITHEEQVLVSEAYDEQVLVTAAYDEQVAYSGNGPYFNEFGNSDDLNAWVNFIYSHPGATGGWGSWVAYYVSTFHPAVYETVIVVDVPEQVIEHPAVYETIHHPAEYKTVEIADPAEPNEFPLKDLPTGGSAAAIALVIIGILVGGYLASRK
jgi:hypothetical protein